AWRGSFAGTASPVLLAGDASTVTVAGTQSPAVIDHEDPRKHDDVIAATYLRGYLPEDILVKVDRSSMAFSLEVRAPFLDADLVDFLLSIPASVKRRGQNGKLPLKKLMAHRLPQQTVGRPKHGFSVPMGDWLRGP